MDRPILRVGLCVGLGAGIGRAAADIMGIGRMTVADLSWVTFTAGDILSMIGIGLGMLVSYLLTRRNSAAA